MALILLLKHCTRIVHITLDNNGIQYPPIISYFMPISNMQISNNYYLHGLRFSYIVVLHLKSSLCTYQ